MTQEHINIGSAEKAGDGESLRSAFKKIESNFTELYSRQSTEDGNTLSLDLKGSVLSDDSSVILDSNTNTVTASGGFFGDLQGNVFGSDSSIIIDFSTNTITATGGIAGNVTGQVTDISNHSISALNNVSTESAQTGQVLKWNGSEWAPASDNSGGGGSGGGGVEFITVAGDDSTQRIINSGETLSILGDGNILSIVDVEGAVSLSLGGTINVDLQGSVFADDSTLLIDAANGTIDATALTGALPALDGSALTGIAVDGADFSGNFTGSVFADDSTQIIDGVSGEVTGNVNNTETSSYQISTTQIRGFASGGVTFTESTLFNSDITVEGHLAVPNIITPDSSALRIENMAKFQSDVDIDGRLSVGGADIQDLIGNGTGGYEFTGGFENRTTGQSGVSDIGTDVEYTAAQVLTREWMRFGFSYERHLANDKPYWNNQQDNPVEAPGAIYGADPNNLPDGFFMDGATARPEAYRGVGLFSGAYMPTGVTSLFDFAEDSSFSPYNQAQTSGDLLYNAASGSYNMSQLNTGDFCSFRFDFNLTPQFANTTVEVGLIWQTRDSNDNATFTFALTGEPLFYGSGTTGRAFLNRPIITAYLASIEDVNARALPAIRADQPVFVQPLTTLFVVGR